MADPIANLCIAYNGTLNVKALPRSGPARDYFFRWWKEQRLPAEGQNGVQSVDIPGARGTVTIRLAIYASDPGANPEMPFTLPTQISRELQVSVLGEYRITSAGIGDPWPPV